MVKLFGPEEKEFQKEMNEHLDKKMEEMCQTPAEATEVPPPVQQEAETNSVSDWSAVGLDVLEQPATAAAALSPLGQEGRQ